MIYNIIFSSKEELDKILSNHSLKVVKGEDLKFYYFLNKIRQSQNENDIEEINVTVKNRKENFNNGCFKNKKFFNK